MNWIWRCFLNLLKVDLYNDYLIFCAKALKSPIIKLIVASKQRQCVEVAKSFTRIHSVLRVVILFFLKFIRFAVEVEDKGMEPEPTFNDEEIVETEQNATIEVKYHNYFLSIHNKTTRQFWK